MKNVYVKPQMGMTEVAAENAILSGSGPLPTQEMGGGVQLIIRQNVLPTNYDAKEVKEETVVNPEGHKFL